MTKFKYNAFAPMLLIFTLHLGACGKNDATYVYGIDLNQLTFNYYSPNMGIHPDQSVLIDPNNPFSKTPPDETADKDNPIRVDKWTVNDLFEPPAAFYSWATWLAKNPTGEHQYYTGLALKGVYQKRHVENNHLEDVKQMAIQAFQALLDHFPASVTYDATGSVSFRLAPLAYAEIIELDGQVKGGWVQIMLADGTHDVIQVPKD